MIDALDAIEPQLHRLRAIGNTLAHFSGSAHQVEAGELAFVRDSLAEVTEQLHQLWSDAVEEGKAEGKRTAAQLATAHAKAETLPRRDLERLEALRDMLTTAAKWVVAEAGELPATDGERG